MKKTLIALGLMVAASGAMAAKPVRAPATPDASSISHLAAVDAEGKQVGIWTSGYLLTTIPERPGVIRLNTDYGDNPDIAQYADGNLYYEFTACVGAPFAGLKGISHNGTNGHILLARGIDGFSYAYPDPDGVPQTLMIRSGSRNYGTCAGYRASSGGVRNDLVTPIPFDLDIVPPIRQELR
jgi:hypothetical protein